MLYRIIAAIGLIFLSTSSAHAAVYTLKPHVSISEEYTDNRNRTETDTIEEYTTTISAGINQSIAAKHLGMNLTYTAHQVQFNETDADSIWNHNASLGFWADLSKYTKLNLRGSYTRNDQPIREAEYNLLGYVLVDDQLIPVVDTTLRTGREQYDTNSTVFSLSHQFGERDTISIHHSYFFLNELEKENGDDSYNLNISEIDLTYWLTPHFGVDISAKYNMGEYGESSRYDEGEGSLTLNRALTRHLNMYVSYKYSIFRHDIATYRNYDLHKPSLGISYQFEKDVSLTLGGGYYIKDSEGNADDTGYFADLSINRTWSFRRGSIDLIGRSGLGRNAFSFEDLGIRRYYGASINANYSFTKHLNAGINAAFQRNEHLDTENDRTRNQGQVGCFFSLVPWRWISIGASYSHIFLRYASDGKDYDENVARLSVSIHPWTYRN